jgi:DNA invertase Pin-like site-specific DNA recombinase
MIAAAYARKSTEQHAADESKSVTRQVAHAPLYAAAKGWTVDEVCIFVDDGISGAEFANRPGFVRLMARLKPRPPFQALIMSEESWLGREAIETAYALKQLVTAGVRVFCYLMDSERTLDSPIEKVMLSLQAMSDEMERTKAHHRLRDKALQLVRAGNVAGDVFGYDNVPRRRPHRPAHQRGSRSRLCGASPSSRPPTSGRSGACGLNELPFGKCPPGAGLQVLLERDGARSLGQLDGSDEFPWSQPGSV